AGTERTSWAEPGRARLKDPEPRVFALDKAEACFRRALEVARRQGAKSFELRAAVSLARLLRDRSRPAEGRHALAEVFGSFTEGWDTADLRDARALLAELSLSEIASELSR